MSLDGFVTGPDDVRGRGLGFGGEPIHDWVMGGPWTYGSDRAAGGATGVDREVLAEAMATGASVIGRRMYDVGRTTYHFVTDGLVDAVQQARAAAGGRLVTIGGGSGKRLFEHLGPVLPTLEQVGVRVSPNATHARYRMAWK